MRGIIQAETGFGKRGAFAIFISPWLAGCGMSQA
jgi:hypothetical protein